MAYDTALTAEEEPGFQQWKQVNAPHDSGDDYDLRGAYKAGLSPDPATGHWPDTYKKPNHPTFSDQSIYAKDHPGMAGSWDGENFKAPYAPTDDEASVLLDSVQTEKDEAKRNQMLDLLGNYRKAKLAAGLEPFAVKPEEAQQKREAMNGLFGGLDQVDAHIPADKRPEFDAALNAAADRNEAKARMVNQAWVVSQYPQFADQVDADWTSVKHQVAKSLFGNDASEIPDTAFYGQIGAHLTKQKAEQDMLVDVLGKIQLEAGKGQGDWLAAWKKAASGLSSNPAWNPDNQDRYRAVAQKVFADTQEKLTPIRSAVSLGQEFYKLAAGSTTAGPDKKDEQGNFVPKSLEEFSAYEQKVAAARKAFTDELERLPRDQQDAALNFAIAGAVDVTPQEMGVDGKANMMEKSVISLDRAVTQFPKNIGRFVAQSASAASEAVLQARNAYYGEQDTPQAAVYQEQAIQQRLDMSRRIDAGLIDAVDPIKSKNRLAQGLYGAIDSLPYMAAAASPASIPLTLMAMAEDNRAHFVDNGVPAGEAAILGFAAAVPQVAIENLQAHLVFHGKLPGFEKWLSKAVGTKLGLATKLAAVAGLETLHENAEEALQDITVPVYQQFGHVLSDAVPDVKWLGKDGELSQFANGRVDTFFSLLPMVLVGTGTSSFKEAAYARQYLSNKTMLKAVGFTENAAEEIAQVAHTGEVEKAQDMMRAGWDDEKMRPKRTMSFKTEAGSNYEVLDNGTTVRTKSDQGLGDSGKKAASEVTVYLPKEDGEWLWSTYTDATAAGKIARIQVTDGLATLEFKEDGKWVRQGKVQAEARGEPQIGLHPLELWSDGAHFGHAITEMTGNKVGEKESANAKADLDAVGRFNTTEQQRAFEELDEQMRASWEEQANPAGARAVRQDDGTWAVLDHDGTVVDQAQSADAALQLVQEVDRANGANSAVRNEDMIDWFKQRGRGGVIEKSEDIRLLSDDVAQGKITQEQAQRIVDLYVALDPVGQKGLTVDTARIYGESERRYNAKTKVYEYVTRLYHGADPLVLVEEESEGYFKEALDRGTITLEQVEDWMKAVGENLPKQSDEKMRRRMATEFFSRYAQAYLTSQSHEHNKAIPLSFRRWLDNMREVFASIFELAKQLIELSEAGKLPEDFRTHLARSVGLDEAFIERKMREEERQSAAEAQGEPLSEWIKGRLPHPEGYSGTLAGEIRDMYDGLTTEVNVAGRGVDRIEDGKVKKARKGYNRVSRSAANAFFAPKGEDVDLDRLREEANAAGFPFETPAELLAAVDQAFAGNDTFAWEKERTMALKKSGKVDKTTDMFDSGLAGGEDFKLWGGTAEDHAGAVDAEEARRQAKAKQEKDQTEMTFSLAQTRTPEFKKWFGDSKVIDENGQPRVVYHGTDQNFSVPGRDERRQEVKQEGEGIWFSEGPKLAHPFLGGGRRGSGRVKDGSNIIPAFLSIQNPVDMSKDDVRTYMSLEQLFTMVGIPASEHGAALDELEGYAKPLRDAWNASRKLPGYEVNWYPVKGSTSMSTSNMDDAEILKSEDAVHRFVESEPVQRFLVARGFDGVKAREKIRYNEGAATGEKRVYQARNTEVESVTWLPFSAGQIKSATGNRGTFDGSNPDITMSLRQDDRAEYDRLQAKLKELGPEKFGTKEYNDIWQQSEDVKNRNGGMPPGEVSGDGSMALRGPAFYSRLTKTVEDSSQGKATGEQWKAMIRNSKIGVNRDEYALASVDDLENGKTYSKQEVLDYLKANEVKVAPVVLGAISDVEGAAAEKRLTEAGFQVEREYDQAYITDANGEDVALDDLPENLRRDAEMVAGNGSQTHFEQYTLPGAEEGSYREALLTVPGQSLGEPTHGGIEQLANGKYRVYAPGLQDAMFDTWAEADAETKRLGKVFPHLATRSLNKLPPGFRMEDKGEGSYPRFQVFGPGPADVPPLRYASGQSEKAAMETFTRLHRSQWHDGHSQYDQVDNPVVRLRYNSRNFTENGQVKTMLFLEEVQAPQAREFEKMPALFQKNWRELGFKWALRKAVEGGFDSLGWTTGDQQAARYDLSKQVRHIDYKDMGDGTKFVGVTLQGGHGGFAVDVKDGKVERSRKGAEQFVGKDLDEVIGKDAAKQILEGTEGRLDATDLKVGGEGLRKLYDQDFLNVVNGLPAVKKFGQKVGTANLAVEAIKPNSTFRYGVVPPEHSYSGKWDVVRRDQGHATATYADEATAKEAASALNRTEDVPVHALTITPEMRASVEQGQATFAIGPKDRPERVQAAIKVRAISIRVEESPTFAKKVKQLVGEMNYEVRGMAVNEKEARKIIEANDGDLVKLLRILHDPTQTMHPATKVALAFFMAEAANKAKNYAAAADIAKQAAMEATAAGQGINELKRWSIFDQPETCQQLLQTEVDRENKRRREREPAVDAVVTVYADVQKEAHKLLKAWIDEINGFSAEKAVPVDLAELPEVTFSLSAEQKATGIVGVVAKMLKQSGAEATERALVEKYGEKVKDHMTDLFIEAQKTLTAKSAKKDKKLKTRQPNLPEEHIERTIGLGRGKTEDQVDLPIAQQMRDAGLSEEQIQRTLDEFRNKQEAQLGMGEEEKPQARRLTDAELEAALANARAGGRGAQGSLAELPGFENRLLDHILLRLEQKMKRDNIAKPIVLKGLAEQIHELLNQKGLAASPEDVKRIVGAGILLPDMTPEQAEALAGYAKRIASTPLDSFERSQQTMELFSYVHDQLKPYDLTDVAFGLWYANVLSSLITSARNIAGNSSMLFLDQAADTIFRNPTTYWPYIEQMMKAVGTGTETAKDQAINTAKTGQDSLQRSQSLDDERRQGVMESKRAPMETARSISRVATRFLSIQDLFFANTAYEMKARQLVWDQAQDMVKQGKLKPEQVEGYVIRSLNHSTDQIQTFRDRAEREWANLHDEVQADYEKANWIRRRTSELRLFERDKELVSRALDFAQKVTLDYPPEGLMGVLMSNLSGIFSKLETAAQDVQNKPVRMLTKSAAKYGRTRVVPFMRIPVNVFNRALDYGPVGYGRALMDSMGVPILLATGKTRTRTAEERADLLKRATLGTLALLPLAILARPPQPDDEPEENPWLQIHGAGSGTPNINLAQNGPKYRPYSVEIRAGGKQTFIDYRMFPLAPYLAAIGSLHDRTRYAKSKALDDKTALVQGWILAQSLKEAFLAGSPVTSLRELSEAAAENQPMSERAVNRTLARGSVGMASNVAIPLTGLWRSLDQLAGGDRNTRDTLLAASMAEIPVASRMNVASIDVLGDTMTNRAGIGWLADWSSMETPEARIYRTFAEKDVSPTDISRYQHDLTPEQFYALAQKRGQYLKDYLLKTDDGETGLQILQGMSDKARTKDEDSPAKKYLDRLSRAATRRALYDLGMGKAAEAEAGKQPD